MTQIDTDCFGVLKDAVFNICVYLRVLWALSWFCIVVVTSAPDRLVFVN